MTLEQFDAFTTSLECELDRRGIPTVTRGDTVTWKDRAGCVKLASLSQLGRTVVLEPVSEWPRLIGSYLQIADSAGMESEARAEISSIRTQLRPSEHLEEADPDGLVWIDALPGTILLLVVDAPDYSRTLSPAEAEALSATGVNLFTAGMLNVRSHQPERHGTTPTTMLTGDIYTSTHALWPERFLELDEDWGAITSVPNRHTVVHHAVSAESGGVLDWLIESGVKIWKNDPGPITPSLFWRQGGEVLRIVVDPQPDGAISVRVPTELGKRINR